MSTPLEVIEKGVHMKGLEKSKNAKECGDLTVLPLGYLSSIHKDQTLELLQALYDELEGKRGMKSGDEKAQYFWHGHSQAIQDQKDNLQALIKMIVIS
jgi:hypothetical protein